MFQIIYNYESAAINKEIDRFLAERPEKAHLRDKMFKALLVAYREHGVLGTLTQGHEEIPTNQKETQ